MACSPTMLAALGSSFRWTYRTARWWSRRAPIGLVAIGISCSRDDRSVDQPRSGTTPCPPGFSANPQRTARLLELLRQTVEGRRLLTTADGATLCFGSIEESSVAEGTRVLLLRTHAGDTQLACRTAHLLTHLANPIPPPNPERCEQWLDRVREKEALAHATENRLRLHLGLEVQSQERFDTLLRQYATRCRNGSRSESVNSVSAR